MNLSQNAGLGLGSHCTSQPWPAWDEGVMQDLYPTPLPLPTPLPRDACFAEAFSRAQGAGIDSYSGWV